MTIVTEAGGMAPEEVEALVTFPSSPRSTAPPASAGCPVSRPTISVIWVEFVWGTDIYQARQVVAERLQRVELPAQAERPELGPISSIMGEITFIALNAEGVPAMELRRLAETVVRRNLLAIPGVSHGMVTGFLRRKNRQVSQI